MSREIGRATIGDSVRIEHPEYGTLAGLVVSSDPATGVIAAWTFGASGTHFMLRGISPTVGARDVTGLAVPYWCWPE